MAQQCDTYTNTTPSVPCYKWFLLPNNDWYRWHACDVDTFVIQGEPTIATYQLLSPIVNDAYGVWRSVEAQLPSLTWMDAASGVDTSKTSFLIFVSDADWQANQSFFKRDASSETYWRNAPGSSAIGNIQIYLRMQSVALGGWSLDCENDPYCAGYHYADLQNVITHELGHGWGLADLHTQI